VDVTHEVPDLELVQWMARELVGKKLEDWLKVIVVVAGDPQVSIYGNLCSCKRYASG